MLNKIQFKIPSCEALEQTHVYAKFMKEFLSGKRELKNDENLTLAEECNVIIRINLPPKLTDPGRFMIPCSISPLIIDHALCD